MDEKQINENSVPAIFYIPDNTVRLTMTAKIIDENDEFHTAEMSLGLADITQARIDGEFWEEDNGKYVLTDEAKEQLKDLN